jgi:predicted HTH domain antitoxin
MSKAVQEWLIENALEQYRDGKITIGKAADIVGIPIREMIAIAAKKGIPFQYNIDDLHEDFRAAQKEIKPSFHNHLSCKH